METALVIMAAGLGSRFGGVKQMTGVGPRGEILMEYAIYDAVRAGFDRIVPVLAPGMLPDVLERFGGGLLGGRTPEGKRFTVSFCTQDNSLLPAWYTVPPERKKPFGTLFAAYCARRGVEDRPFGVINADDYYGVTAFRDMHELLVNLQPGEGCMVGYRLENTVSENGTVSRGVCTVENGLLCDAEELRKIRRFADGTLRDETQPDRILDPHSVTSMNLFGFRPEVFGDMEDYLASFLRDLAPEAVTAECALPTMVDTAIKSGKLRVLVRQTHEKWAGMTYREDMEQLEKNLAALHAAGTYPPSLR